MNKNKNQSPNSKSHPKNNSNASKKRRRGKKSKNSNTVNSQNKQTQNKPKSTHSKSNHTHSIPTPTQSKPKSKLPTKFSYASRISSGTPTNKVKKQLTIRSSTPHSQIDSNDSTDAHKSLHGNISKNEILDVRMQQRDICYVAGLPKSICTRQVLGGKKWFGQFGRIRDITITDNQNCIRTNWMCVHIKYFENNAASKAVKSMNHKRLDDGRVLEANYGTQRYCEFFVNNKKCHKSNCPFRHSWCQLNEIVNFNNHHQIVYSQNTRTQNNNTVVYAKPVKKQTIIPTPIPIPIPIVEPIQSETIIIPIKAIQPIRPAPKAVVIHPIQPLPPLQPGQTVVHVPMVKEVILPAVNSVPSTDNSTDLKQNDIEIVQNEIEIVQNEEIMDTYEANNSEEIIREGGFNMNVSEDLSTVNKEREEMEIEMNELYAELDSVRQRELSGIERINVLSKECEIKDSEIIKLQRISRRLADAHNKIKNENETLMYENEELKQKMRRAELQMQTMSQQMKVNRSRIANAMAQQSQQSRMNVCYLDYTLWECMDVYQWVMSVCNGKFKKYSESLSINLKIENIDGRCIKALTMTDMHRIGISDFKDKQLLLQQIHALKSNLGLDSLVDDIVHGGNQVRNASHQNRQTLQRSQNRGNRVPMGRVPNNRRMANNNGMINQRPNNNPNNGSLMM